MMGTQSCDARRATCTGGLLSHHSALPAGSSSMISHTRGGSGGSGAHHIQSKAHCEARRADIPAKLVMRSAGNSTRSSARAWCCARTRTASTVNHHAMSHSTLRYVVMRCRRKQHPVDCPCLVLWADSDTKMGVQLLNGIEEVVARPEVHVLENSSHWLQQDKCAPCRCPSRLCTAGVLRWQPRPCTA